MGSFTINIINVLYKSFDILLLLLPYLIIGALLSELLKYLSIHKYVMNIKKSEGVAASAIAAITGMVSPLCTFGTVPVVMTLQRMGVSGHLLVIFLIASSMMNPQLFILTAGGISLEMALMRVFSILLFCLILGLAIKKIPDRYIFKEYVLECEDRDHIFVKKDFKVREYLRNCAKTLEYVGFYMVIGILITSAFEVFVPDSLIQWLTDKGNLLSMMILGLLSIPLYSCGGGTIPFMNSMLHSGFSKGAVLVFFNVGSATRFTALAALLSIIRTRALVGYIAALSIFSMLIGCFY